jgi:putative FmdB family regulatory protein
VPLFDFRCRACGQTTEHLLRRDSPAPTCPECDSADLERLVSLATVSSPQTQRAARRSLRTRNQAIRRDAQHEEHKRLHDHTD